MSWSINRTECIVKYIQINYWIPGEDAVNKIVTLRKRLNYTIHGLLQGTTYVFQIIGRQLGGKYGLFDNSTFNPPLISNYVYAKTNLPKGILSYYVRGDVM